MTFGFFIDPSPALASLVLERKAAAGTRWPQATYLSHPVHATLLAGAFAEMSEWVATPLGTPRDDGAILD